MSQIQLAKKRKQIKNETRQPTQVEARACVEKAKLKQNTMYINKGGNHSQTTKDEEEEYAMNWVDFGWFSQPKPNSI